jgi:hypothetical protein
LSDGTEKPILFVRDIESWKDACSRKNFTFISWSKYYQTIF